MLFVHCPLYTDLAIKSVGEGNRYGHPDQETLARLKEYEVPVYLTESSGSIVVLVTPDSWRWD